MGKEIVYCGGCGKSLREDDFTRNKAHTVDNRPFCIACQPLPESRVAQIQTSSKLAALTKASTTRLPAVAPSTRRRHSDGETDSYKGPLLIGGALIGTAVVILGIFLLSSSSRPPEEPPPAPAPAAKVAKPPTPPAPPPATTDQAAAVFKELEAFVATAPRPVALLQRCDEVRSALKGSAFEARLKAIEEGARASHKNQQIDASLEEVKKLRALDTRYERTEEILRLLNATLSISGPRRAEVEGIIRDYDKEARDFASKPAPPPPPPQKQPLAKQPSRPPPTPLPDLAPVAGTLHDTGAGGCVNHWLVLGPFPCRPDVQALYDGDLLRPEAAHVPAPGLEVAPREGDKLRWTPVTLTDGKLHFRKVDALGAAFKTPTPAIAFAACWILSDSDVEVKIRMSADRGFYLYMDNERIRNQPHALSVSGAAEDVIRVKLVANRTHRFLFKVVGPEEPFALRFKLTDNGGERVPGVRVLTQLSGASGPRKVLYSESFNEGPGKFENGQLADGGVDGTKAYEVTKKAVWVERVFKKPVTSEMTLRFKVKPIGAVPDFQVVMWSSTTKINSWYHVRGLKTGEWNPVEFKVSAVRGGWHMDGPSVEGDTPFSIRLAIDDGRALVDDFELFE